MRYSGQSYELNVTVTPEDLDHLERGTLDRLFHKAHERAYGFAAEGEPITIVNLRVTGLADIPKPELPRWPSGSAEPPAQAVKEHREVYFQALGRSIKCPIFNRNRLEAGNRIAGPAIVEELDSTTLVLPDYTAEVDEHGNLVIRTKGG
jgi:N-methylhydantoinase A